ncbi:MAG: DedA family inner membrane protein YdjX [uncultured Rubrobacteraceae bacterium]|uniref:TVP38/TMEM64 family membrane protein n=1 Tax=uncultured Rubrobacteraceae bacterium TaxID=349277 RepID=A0A6J4R1X8_9ACTN|nr:MAG: DedA family inner membrane protein YdjX [uncultured Rubrobacteraceae bacterium]
MSEETGKPPSKKREAARAAGAGLVLLTIAVMVWITGLVDYLSLDNFAKLRGWIEGFGALAPIVFVAMYAVAVLAFLPATPLTLLAGLVFGAVWGALWTWIGAMIGATLAFLVGRYATRGLVESWREENERVRRLDEGVERHGWRMLLITRLVPAFPFSLQNYAYGLTKIPLGTYVLLTGVCIVPGAAVYTFAGGSLAAARENLTRTLLYLGIAAVLFVLISLAPRWIGKKNG